MTITASNCSGPTASSCPTRSNIRSKSSSIPNWSRCWRRARISVQPGASTTGRAATSSSPSARCRAICRSMACAWWSIAPTAAYRVAPQALWELGAEVISLGVEPDGFNINRECGSTEPAALCQKVKEMRADIGIALDGAGDPVLTADERGRIVDGDQLLAVIAESWKADGRLAKPGVVATVMSNLGLERYLGSLAISLARTPVGDRYVLEHMRAQGFNVGGESSGHIILSDYTTTGDGLLTALQVLAVVKKQQQPVSKVSHR